jgi:hypothetical protein
MKIWLACLLILSISPELVQASANSGAPNFCPRYYCVATSTSGDYHHMNPGYGYDDELLVAQQIALSDCRNSSGSCAIESCDKNTGPVLKVPWACQSQW